MEESLELEPIDDPKERQNALDRSLRQQLELQELTAHLDALTGGWFSTELKSQKATLAN